MYDCVSNTNKLFESLCLSINFSHEKCIFIPGIIQLIWNQKRSFHLHHSMIFKFGVPWNVDCENLRRLPIWTYWAEYSCYVPPFLPLYHHKCAALIRFSWCLTQSDCAGQTNTYKDISFSGLSCTWAPLRLFYRTSLCPLQRLRGAKLFAVMAVCAVTSKSHRCVSHTLHPSRIFKTLHD